MRSGHIFAGRKSNVRRKEAHAERQEDKGPDISDSSEAAEGRGV